jgi:hypothetical protein
MNSNIVTYYYSCLHWIWYGMLHMINTYIAAQHEGYVLIDAVTWKILLTM